MRVFFVGLRSSVYPWAEAGPLKEPRSRWTGYPGIQNTNNQIRLKVEYEDKTVFITPHGVYCYTTMPFGLKNDGAIYQQCMQACLKEQIGRNVEVYINDIIIKSAKADSLLDDLRETFANIDRYSIKLNPKKCSFRVPTGQLLGYLISKRGIEGNPEKI
jgi:hypothetical protein